MAKVALLIGITTYTHKKLSPLPCAANDIEAMFRVLQDPAIGGFDEVKRLLNPDLKEIQVEINTLFAGRAREDLALFFFSGHGLRDENGMFYFSNQSTDSEQIEPTATSARNVHDMMSKSRCHQVVILDCCFSGAFSNGLTAKSGRGKAVLSASGATRYAFEQQGSELSVYTRYIVEGMETGVADENGDGLISTDELHRYAQKKVQEVSPVMSPNFFAVEEGHRIHIAKAPTNDPKLQYRKEAEKYAEQGEFSSIGNRILAELREASGLTSDEAQAIEAEVLKPYQEYKKKLQQYKQALVEALNAQKHLSGESYKELKRYQEVLGLRDEDTSSIERNFLLSIPGFTNTTKFSRKLLLNSIAGISLLISTGIGISGSLDIYKKTATKPIEILIQEKRYKECLVTLNQSFSLRFIALDSKQICSKGLISQAEEIFEINNSFDEAMRLLNLIPKDVLSYQVEEARRNIIDLKHYREARKSESECDWFSVKENIQRMKIRSKEMQVLLDKAIRKINTGEALLQKNNCPSRAIIQN